MSRARDNAKQGGMVQVIPTSVTVGSGTATVAANGQIIISGASNLVINGVFSSRFENYKMVMSQVSVTTGTAGIYMKMSKSGTSSDTLYYGHSVYGLYSGTTIYSLNRNNSADWQMITVATATDTSGGFVEFQSPFVSSSRTSIQHIGSNYDASWTVHGLHNVKDNYDGIRLIPSASAINTTIRFYGYNDGGA
jgi:hypothetical protein